MFGAATATNLYTGRLAFAFGALPALGAILALDVRRDKLACALALLSALCSPVAALFAAIVGLGLRASAAICVSTACVRRCPESRSRSRRWSPSA